MADATTAVDVGARAWFDHQQAQRRDDGRLRGDGQLWQWEDLTPVDQHALRQLVLPVVTAVLEHVGAEVNLDG